MTSSGVRRWFRALILGDECAEGLETRVSRKRRRWGSYACTLTMTAAVTSVGFRIEHVTAPTNLVMLYLLCVVISSLRWGLGQAALCAVASALLFDDFFLPWPGIFVFADGWYLITFLTLLGVRLLISTLASEARAQANRARRREAYATAMYNLSRSLIAAADLNQIVAAVADHMTHTFRLPVVLALASEGAKSPGFQNPEFDYSDTERTAAASAVSQPRNIQFALKFFF